MKKEILKRVFIPILLFLLTLLVVGRNLNKPFEGIHDWNGARYGNIARNYLRYGLFTTRFAQVENSGVVERGEFKYLTHYPPLLPFLIFISYKIFGISEWATRLVPLLATAGTVVTIFLIGRTIFDYRAGLFASLFALVTPMIRYFGKNPVHEPLSLFFAALAFLGSAKVVQGKKEGWWLLIVGIIFSLLTNWSGVFLLIGVSIILLPTLKKGIVKIWIPAAVIIISHFLHVYLITGSFLGGELREVFLLRTSLGGDASLTPFNLFEFLNRVRLWSFTLFSLTLILMALGGAIFVAKKGLSSLKLFFLGTTIYGLGAPLVFPNATFIHSYFIYPISLSIVLLAGLFVSAFFKKVPLIILLYLLIIPWVERESVFVTLENSSHDRLAVEIGKKMKENISQGDWIYITPYEYGASRLPFLSFYSDRKITLDPDSGYNWVVSVDKNDAKFERILLPKQKTGI